jgi:hypothetical protein
MQLHGNGAHAHTANKARCYLGQVATRDTIALYVKRALEFGDWQILKDRMNNMTDEELRVKVAELCGWRHVQWDGEDVPEDWAWFPPGIPSHPVVFMSVPHYESDLNAMHEAEKLLTTFTHRRDWQFAMCEILGVPRATELSGAAETNWLFFHATARQRALAFVKVMG